MRGFVFLLILANLLFFAWTQGYLGGSSNADAFRMQQQLLANQVTVVARDVPPPETTKTEAVATPVENRAVADTCILLSDLSTAIADQLATRLAEKFPSFKVSRTNVAANSSYWVYIPPLANKKEVDTKTSELKKLGIDDFFVVQETGINNRAISLGLFSGKETATAYLETLRGKGVKSAKVAERPAKQASATLEIHGPETQGEAVRQSVVEAQPEAKPGACKSQTTATQ